MTTDVNVSAPSKGVLLESTETGGWRRVAGGNDLLVDVYDSAGMAGYALVVPKDTALDSFSDEVGEAIKRLQPLVKMRTGFFDELFSGGLAAFLRGQIKDKGAGLIRTKIEFTEIVQR